MRDEWDWGKNTQAFDGEGPISINTFDNKTYFYDLDISVAKDYSHQFDPEALPLNRKLICGDIYDVELSLPDCPDKCPFSNHVIKLLYQLIKNPNGILNTT